MRECAKRMNSCGQPLHLTWVESHATSLGIPDLNYCYYGVDGWLELKAGPNIDIRPAQVLWMKEHIVAGGHPLFLIQWSDLFMVIPGSRASHIRQDTSYENVLTNASTVWTDKLPEKEFGRVLRNPRREYEQFE